LTASAGLSCSFWLRVLD